MSQTGTIIAAVLGTVAAVLVIVGVIVFFVISKKKTSDHSTEKMPEIDDSKLGNSNLFLISVKRMKHTPKHLEHGERPRDEKSSASTSPKEQPMDKTPSHQLQPKLAFGSPAPTPTLKKSSVAPKVVFAPITPRMLSPAKRAEK